MTLQAPLIKGEKKQETCEGQLRRMCKNIADSITYPVDNSEHGEHASAGSWMEDTYGIRYLVDQDKRYLGAEILCAGGGPTIWVDTWNKEVKGYWGGDRVTVGFCDNLDLDGYCEEMYG